MATGLLRVQFMGPVRGLPGSTLRALLGLVATLWGERGFVRLASLVGLNCWDRLSYSAGQSISASWQLFIFEWKSVHLLVLVSVGLARIGITGIVT